MLMPEYTAGLSAGAQTVYAAFVEVYGQHILRATEAAEALAARPKL